MTKKIKVQMFGNRNQLVPESCGWGPSTSCGPGQDPRTLEIYEELKTFLENTDVKDKIEMEFIDIDKDDLSKYPKERKLLDVGYQLPITLIASKPAFSGQVDKMKAYLTLKKMWCLSSKFQYLKFAY